MKQSTTLALLTPLLIAATPAALPSGPARPGATAPVPVERIQLPFELEQGARFTFGIERGVDAPDAKPLEWRLELEVQRESETGGALLGVRVRPESHDDPRPTEFQVMVDAAGKIMNLGELAASEEACDEVGGLRPWDELAFVLGSGLHARKLERGEDYTIAVHGKGKRKSALASAKLTFDRIDSAEGRERFHFRLEGKRPGGQGEGEASLDEATGTIRYRGSDGLLEELRYGVGQDAGGWIRIARRD